MEDLGMAVAHGSLPEDADDGTESDRQGPSRRFWVDRAAMRSIGHDPDYRFSLANERTFLAWIRTALALLAGGIGVVQLVPKFKFPGGSRTLGVILVVLSIAVAVGSYFRWASNERAMRLDRALPRSYVPQLAATGLAIVAVLSLIMVIVGG